MKASEITIGKTYWMKVSGRVVPVRVNNTSENYKGRTVYNCTNTVTGRDCQAHSASKFRGEVNMQKIPTVDPEDHKEVRDMLDKLIASLPEDK